MSTDTSRIVQKYDKAMYMEEVRDIWGDSDFCNFGYWGPQTSDHREACENLVEALLGFIPEKRGSVLDVACGLGATTRHLARYFDPAKVVGVNISDKQLATARGKLPGSGFARMDAVRLAFRDASFDTVVCVEAAFHFDPRESFIQEAFRVLKPGGRLVLSDILAHRWVARLRSTATVRNMTVGPEAYRRAYTAAGFRDVQIVDATTESIKRLCRYHRRWGLGRLARSWDPRPLLRLMAFDTALLVGARQYLLVSARKP